jgi:hypothetical protein
MPSKSKEAHLFNVGDPAIVRDVKTGFVMNNGVIQRVTAMRVIFEGPTNCPPLTGRWAYRRKGTRWVQMKKDRYELEPAP